MATLALAAAQGDDIAGNWKAVVVGGVRHKTIGQATFEFRVDGSHLTGIAHIGSSYPGTAPISNGEINGNRVPFTVIGEHPSSNGVHGNEIRQRDS